MAETTAPRASGYAADALIPAAAPTERQRPVFVLNAMLLFACASMYFGTGGSLVLFSFPIAPQLTPDNYFLPFVAPVEAATRFFTYMTIVMCASAVVMAWSEWRTGYRWIPLAVLAAVIAATALTIYGIFPYNHEMEAHIADAARLRVVLDRWMLLNKLRVSLWILQWVFMSVYFAQKAMRAPKARV